MHKSFFPYHFKPEATGVELDEAGAGQKVGGRECVTPRAFMSKSATGSKGRTMRVDYVRLLQYTTLTMTINAIAELENLQEAGVPEKQAKAHLRLISSLMGSELATKTELKQVEAELKRIEAELKRDIKQLDAKIETVKADLQRDIKELEGKIGLQMIITSGSFAFLILGALVTLAKLGLLAPQ